MNRFELFKIIFDKKDYSLAEEVCKFQYNDNSLKTLAGVLFFDKKYERAEVLYKKLHMFTEYGYCRLYQNDKETADKVWFSLKDTSPLIIWAKALSGYIERKRTKEPSFFQIRNFYETDLDTLLSLKMNTYAENLINSIQYFSETNPEVYKYTGRVLYNHGYYDYAEKFLTAGKDIVWEDAELHFLDAEVKLAKNEKRTAIQALEHALEVSPSYYPAVKLLENIK